MDEFYDDIEKWKLIWVDVGDSKVCPDCRIRAKLEGKTLLEWHRLGLPGAGCTICRDRCRCLLLPEEIFNIYPSLRGQTIRLRDDEYLQISEKVDYRVLKHLDDLVYEYETITENWNLPDNYYSIYDMNERITFLKKVIQHIKNDSIPYDLWLEILKANPYLRKKKR